MPLNLGLGTLNIYTQVGLITLIGLITKHGILLVEFANQQREQHGMRRRDAIIASAKVRLRPILMTTAAMALGVVPLIISSGAGAAARYSMGLVIFTGILVGTMFTLFVVPMFYTFIASKDLPHHAEKPDPELDAGAAELGPRKYLTVFRKTHNAFPSKCANRIDGNKRKEAGNFRPLFFLAGSIAAEFSAVLKGKRYRSGKR